MSEFGLRRPPGEDRPGDPGGRADPRVTPDPRSGELTRRWVEGWTHARRLAREPACGGALVRVGYTSRDTEIVLADPGPDDWSCGLARIGGRPRAMLTVVSARADAYVVDLPDDVRVDRVEERLMTRLLPPRVPAPAGVPAGYQLDVEELGTRYVVRLLQGESVAAEGTVGVAGTDATYDAIETVPRHRRRGLARWVLSALDSYAVGAGAREGVLVATEDGARLYTPLGWRTVAPMRSLLGHRVAGP